LRRDERGSYVDHMVMISEDTATRLSAALVGGPPAVSTKTEWTWGGAPLPLAASGYLRIPQLPEEIVTSVRCLVAVGGSLVVCETPGGSDIWPGGRREPGEDDRRTAVREVREETGVELIAEALQPLGFLHYRHLGTPAAGYPYPVPDFLQAVYLATAPAQVTALPEGWIDTDGWVRRSYLADPAALRRLELDALQRPFVEAALRLIGVAEPPVPG
jgi:8-oxo-dGTP pyrophosphatase MutT (NUDIX family)